MNDNHERAMSRLRNGTTNEVARAQAEATLALAYEQRTANMIALETLLQASGANITVDAIQERMGFA
jgi:hypothetical protein